MREGASDGGPCLWLSTQGALGCPLTLPWALLRTGTCSSRPPAMPVTMTGKTHRDRRRQSPDLCPQPWPPACGRPENAPPRRALSLCTWAGRGKAGGPAPTLFSPLRRALAWHPGSPKAPSRELEPWSFGMPVIVGAHAYFVSRLAQFSVHSMETCMFRLFDAGTHTCQGWHPGGAHSRAPSQLCGLQLCTRSLQLRAFTEPELTAVGREAWLTG